MRRILACLVPTLLVLAACTDSDHVVVDELGDQFAGADTDTDKATDVMLSISNDYRKCVSPLCGGVFAKRTNYAKVRCDGAWRKECYLADLDFSAASVPPGYDLLSVRQAVENGNVLLRGTIVKATEGAAAGLNVLLVSEVWLSATQAAGEGVFVSITPSGIYCISAPCPNFHERRVNSTLSATIADIDFAPSGATDEQIGAAIGEAFTTGLIVVGYRYTVYANGASAKGRTATQFFTQLEPPCMVTGCSNQVCADEQVMTTCEYLEEYACYAEAECKRQEDGQCGFTQTPDLEACLAAFGADQN
ncbi:MAG: hypothetical protein IPL79_17385 [Myxococcales bacterium]|nr:hypothetical protein [Myxococcales bacterium]